MFRQPSYLLADSKYSLEASTSGLMVAAPGVQLHGKTVPFLSVHWKPSTNLKASSTFLPTGKSLMVMCLTVPFGSMMNRPLKAIPSSSIKTP